ncbi:MAG: amino acid ABC transporter substrate-binding protein [Bacillota bacterium]
MRKLYFILALALILALVAGCGGNKPEEPAQDLTKEQDETEILKVGAAVALSGADARSGEICKRAYDLWQDTVNAQGGIDVAGKKYMVEMKYYDDKSDAQTATKLVEKLIVEDGVQFILAPFGSGIVYAASTITEKYKVPMIAGQAAAANIYKRGYKYIFSTTADTDDYLRSTFELTETLDPPINTVAILYENGLFSGLCAEASKGFAEERNMEVVYFDKYESTTNDLSPALLEVAAKKPDLFVVIGWPETSAIAQRQIKDLNLDFPLVAQAFGPAIPAWRESVGDAALYVLAEEQFYYDDESSRDHVFGTAKDYTKLHMDRYGYIPTYDDANSAAAALALQLAIEKAQSIDREKVRDALASLDEPTFVGRLKFKENGGRYNPRLYAVQIQSKNPKDNPVFVYPKDYAQAEIVYPMPKFSERE